MNTGISRRGRALRGDVQPPPPDPAAPAGGPPTAPNPAATGRDPYPRVPHPTSPLPPALLALLALLPACASRGGAETAPGFATPRLHHLLDLEDARAPMRELEPFLRDPEPEVRARAALALARLKASRPEAGREAAAGAGAAGAAGAGGEEGLPGGDRTAALLRRAAADPEPRVRAAAALAMGLTDDPELAGDALALVGGPGGAGDSGGGASAPAGAPSNPAGAPSNPAGAPTNPAVAESSRAVSVAAASAAVRLAGDRCWKEERFAALFTHPVPAVRRAALRAAVMEARGWKEKPVLLPAWIPAAFADPATPPDARAAVLLVFRSLLPPKPPRSFQTDPPDLAVGFLQRVNGALREDPDPDVRAACALALGALATGGTGGLDLRLSSEPVGRVRVNLLRALGSIDDPAVLPPLLHALAEDADFGARAAAAQALAARGGRDPARAGEALFRASGRDPSRLVRVEAVAALHALGEAAAPWSVKGVRRAARSADPFLRAAAAGDLVPLETLAALARDPEVRVREAAVDAAGSRGREGLGVCVDALRDPDPVVAGIAAGHVGGMGAREAAGILAAVLAEHPAPASFPDEDADRRASFLDALAKVDPEGARPFAERALGDPDPSVRAMAAEVLSRGEGPAPAMPLPPRLLPFPDRRALRVADAGAARVRFETERGTFVVATLPGAAPVEVARLLARVREGGYDGTLFHRIVPNFVAQGGDPRGDGSGSGGAPARQEFSGAYYLRGTLGVPRSSHPDSGGCQLFFCHGSTPHLDQRYAITGQVVRGLDVIDRLDLGDRILRASVE